MTPFFYSPSRGVWIWLRGAMRRLRCHHHPIPDFAGYDRCERCGSYTL
jgi:hypothetical protein